MNMTDHELIRSYVNDRSEAAFEELVRRHINLVYSSALRQMNGRTHLAEDVCQLVFASLAEKAAGLVNHASLTGWLYTNTRFAAASARRAENRRSARERAAHAMNTFLPSTEPDWEQIRPLLDEVMHTLDAPDRQAVLLRHFERRTFGEIGARFGVSENAARMRVERALDKLHAALVKRGISSTTLALAAMLTANAVGAAPAPLARKVAGLVLSGKLAGSGMSLGLPQFLAPTRIKSAMAIAGVAIIAAIILISRRSDEHRNPALAAASAPLTTVDSNLSSPPEPQATAQPPDLAEPQTIRDQRVQGVVLLPDGRPAADTSVALLTFERGAGITDGRLTARSSMAPTLMKQTDDQGRFEFDADPDAHSLVASDPVNGFGLLRTHHSTQPFTIQLQPWGRIEGQLILSGQPAPNRYVTMTFGLNAFRSVTDGLLVSFSKQQTDADGRFTYEFIPPGDLTLHLMPGTNEALAQETVAEVRAGETVQLQIGGQGRMVKGKLMMEDDSEVDWTQLTMASLVSNLPKPAAEPPPTPADLREELQKGGRLAVMQTEFKTRLQPADLEGRLQLLDFFDESREWRAYERAGRSFPLVVAADGSFSVEGVRPGPYKLTVNTFDPGPIETRFFRKITSSLRADVTVPEGSYDAEPVDLGVFHIHPEKKQSAVISFDANLFP
jgi:RNA polymerase sigma factor (sigma-70 family)